MRQLRVPLLRVVAPLLAGVILLGVFIVLLIESKNSEAPAPSALERAREDALRKIKEDQQAEKARRAVEVPPRPEWKPTGTGLARWSMRNAPEGWDSEVAERIAKLFEAMDVTPGDPELADRISKAREELRAYLAGLGPEAIPTLSAILNHEGDFIARRFVIEALGNLGPRSELATLALKEVYDKERSDERSGAPVEVNHLIEAFGNLKNDSSFEMMNSLIEDRASNRDYYRDKLVEALGKHPRAEESLPKFHEWLDEEDPSIRNHSAQALGNLGKRESVDYLIGRFEREPYVPVRQTILGSLGKIGDSSAVPFLQDQAMNGSAWEIRLSAANALRHVGTPQAMKVLRYLRESEREDRVRTKIEGWLAEASPRR